MQVPTNKSINIQTGLQDKQDIFAFPEERQKATISDSLVFFPTEAELRFLGFISPRRGLYEPEAESREENKLIRLILSENILALCLNNDELISNPEGLRKGLINRQSTINNY
jgi:hypothetical protein